MDLYFVWLVSLKLAKNRACCRRTLKSAGKAKKTQKSQNRVIFTTIRCQKSIHPVNFNDAT
tara:strand:- start:2214 stop:2396 length:183 start_codon:yes stop_codon:yes gene_type:complete